MNGISYLSLDEELLALMYQAGFSQLNLALVSSDSTVRETTKRPHTIEAYLRVVHRRFNWASVWCPTRFLVCRKKAWPA